MAFMPFVAGAGAYNRVNAAIYCGVSQRVFDKAAADGLIEVTYPTSHPVYSRSALDAYLESLPNERP